MTTEDTTGTTETVVRGTLTGMRLGGAEEAARPAHVEAGEARIGGHLVCS